MNKCNGREVKVNNEGGGTRDSGLREKIWATEKMGNEKYGQRKDGPHTLGAKICDAYLVRYQTRYVVREKITKRLGAITCSQILYVRGSRQLGPTCVVLQSHEGASTLSEDGLGSDRKEGRYGATNFQGDLVETVETKTLKLEKRQGEKQQVWRKPRTRQPQTFNRFYFIIRTKYVANREAIRVNTHT